MRKRTKPKKPVRNPSHIVFTAKGAVYPVVEQLPRGQENLEFTVGRKFLGALAHFEGIQLDGLARGSEPADLTCRSPDGTDIKLQIVEVVDQLARKLRHMRSSYLDALLQELGDGLRVFSGCRVSLVDSSEPPYFPSVNSDEGRKCVHHLAEHIRSVGSEISTLEPTKMRSRKTKTVNPERIVWVSVERAVPAGESVPYKFESTGGSPTYHNIPKRLLSVAVRSKIDRQYAKPPTAKFVLLAYSVDEALMENDPDVAESQQLLETLSHPFDEVWFLYPYADKELGHLLHIWPKNCDG